LEETETARPMNSVGVTPHSVSHILLYRETFAEGHEGE